jgi:hypothetical protein
MNYLVFRAARLLLLLVLAAALPVLAAGRTVSRRLRAMLVTLVVLSALAFVNFGFFHVFSGQRIHYWDAFHYFVGAKYLPELGYTRLYEATWLAGREMGAFADIEWIRDLPTYQARHTRSIDAAAVRARFTDARWRAFKQDLLVFGPRIPDWRRLFLDHGFNDPPPRAMLLHALLRWAPATPTTLALVTSIDYVLIAGALWSARVAFGPVAGAVGAAFFFLNFFGRFDFIGGSILRWDWIAALIFGIAAFARGAGITAGLCIAYAVLARLFPVAFLVPLVIKWIQIRRTGAVDRTLDRCLTASAVLLVTIALMLGLAGDSVLIAEFVTKIRLHGETAFTNHVGLGTWLVFQTASWTIHEGVQTVEPAAVMAARPAPWIATYSARPASGVDDVRGPPGLLRLLAGRLLLFVPCRARAPAVALWCRRPVPTTRDRASGPRQRRRLCIRDPLPRSSPALPCRLRAPGRLLRRLARARVRPPWHRCSPADLAAERRGQGTVATIGFCSGAEILVSGSSVSFLPPDFERSSEAFLSPLDRDRHAHRSVVAFPYRSSRPGSNCRPCCS